LVGSDNTLPPSGSSALGIRAARQHRRHQIGVFAVCGAAEQRPLPAIAARLVGTGLDELARGALCLLACIRAIRLARRSKPELRRACERRA
jgi:hypothetical protein